MDIESQVCAYYSIDFRKKRCLKVFWEEYELWHNQEAAINLHL